jgi:NADPH:quinone reductase-like Zn-dependent oxidoreductase
MSDSRSTKFAKDIQRQTNGRGVDVILNSLTGELLDESWRLLADDGSMVEIGKRDIIERNLLSMEPFNRNCSFHALDISFTRQVTDELVERYVYDFTPDIIAKLAADERSLL